MKLKLREADKLCEELVNMKVKRHEAEEERNRLENVLAKEKVKIKECEQDAEAFRSEVLGLKSDKKKIGLTLASIEEEVKKLKIENKGLKKELDSNHIKVEMSKNTCDKIVVTRFLVIKQKFKSMLKRITNISAIKQMKYRLNALSVVLSFPTE